MEEFTPASVGKLALATFASGATLGPWCDSQHSSHDVLHYARPDVQLHWGWIQLETCYWVPVLFGEESCYQRRCSGLCPHDTPRKCP